MIKTDLLVIGSGFGGLWAALTAMEHGVKDAAIVDKGSVGFSSQSKLAAGNTIFCEPRDDLDLWIKEFAQAQEFFCHQDMVEDMLETSFGRLEKLRSLGIRYRPFRQASRGLQHVKKRLTPHWKEKTGGSAVVSCLRKQIKDSKVKLFPKIMITSILYHNGRIAGAVGFHRITGDVVTFHARAVVIAAADCSFRGNYACTDQVTGDAFRLAYDAGVRLNNLEFLCHNTAPPSYGFEGTGPAAAFGAKFLNKNKRPFMREYNPDADKVEVNFIVQAMVDEVNKGNGPPFYFDLSPLACRFIIQRGMMEAGGWIPLNLRRLKEAGIKVFSEPQEWLPAVQTLRGGIRTDRNTMTDLPGLFAAGLSQAFDPGLFGGWSSSRAMWSGENAGKAAAQFLKDTGDSDPCADQEQKLKDMAARALHRKTGTSPDEVCALIQKVVFPYRISLRKHEDRLKEALAEIIRIRQEEVSQLKAVDPHELGKAHEVESMALVAELFLRGSLERKESRGDHHREDYPRINNEEFLKWINFKKDERGETDCSFEPVPLSTYRHKP